MSIRWNSRVVLALTLALVVTLVQLSALTAIVVHASREYYLPMMPWWEAPFLYQAEVFQDELVYQFNEAQTINLQSVNAFHLPSGRVRRFSMPDLYPNPGLTADGDHFWAMESREIYEVDETAVITHRISEPLETLGPWASTRPFIHEGYLTLVTRDNQGAFRLHRFVNGEWRDQGEVFVPGNNLRWLHDEQSGEPKLVLRSDSQSDELSRTFVTLKVVSVRGQDHVIAFQSEISPAKPDEMKLVNIIYRVGCDFVKEKPDAASPQSSGSSTSDPAGWTTLTVDADFKARSGWIRTFSLGEKLYLCDNTDIFVLPETEQRSTSITHQRVVHYNNRGELGLVNQI